MPTNLINSLEFAAVLHEEMRMHMCTIPGASAIVNPYHTAPMAAALIRAGKRLHRLAEESCNGHATEAGADACDRAIARTQKLITALLAPYGIGARFGGDPRGCVLQLILPVTKRVNGWAGEGYCVPR